MTAMLGFFTAIADGVTAALEFLLTLIADIAYMTELLAKFVSELPQYLSFLPAPILAMVTTLFAIVVIYKILGREG